MAQAVEFEEASTSAILTAVAPPPHARSRAKIEKPVFRPAYIGVHRCTSAYIHPGFGVPGKNVAITENCFKLHRITRRLYIVPNTRSIGKVFLIEFRAAAQGISKLPAL